MSHEYSPVRATDKILHSPSVGVTFETPVGTGAAVASGLVGTGTVGTAVGFVVGMAVGAGRGVDVGTGLVGVGTPGVVVTPLALGS